MTDTLTRREFVRNAAALAAAPAQTLHAALAPQRQPLDEFDYANVRLTGGPLKVQYDRIRASYLGLDNDRLLKVYRERAELPAPGAAMGGWYDADGFVPGHSLGQYISGLARFAQTTSDPACHAKVSELVDGFGATLGPQNRIFAGPNAEKVWPCYILDKHLAGLIDAYQLCGISEARDLISRVYLGGLPYIPDRGRDRVGKKNPPYDETYVLPETLFAASALVGDRSMHERAVAYLLDRDFFDPLARGEDVLPGRHAYSHAIALSSAGKAHLVLGDEKYLRAMQWAWTFLTTRQQYATGGWGPNETFITPHTGELYASLNSTVDHFETPCGSYAAIKLARYLICATADGRYGDGLERVLYNTILAAKFPDGDGDYPYYSTYSPDARKVYYPKKWPCCSGTLVECVADYVKNIYFRSADGVAVNLYTPSELAWNRGGGVIRLTQDTNYPLADTIRIRIESSGAAAFALYLRIPAWLTGPASIQVNGRIVHPTVRLGFAAIQRTWHSGDEVILNLPQEFRTEPIDDLHAETVAILRGPIVYVLLSPVANEGDLRGLDGIRPADGPNGTYVERIGNRERTYVPLYRIQDESYTTYFHKA
jgi:uncharacterized protein